MRSILIFCTVCLLCGCAVVPQHPFGRVVVPLKWTPMESEILPCEQAVGVMLNQRTHGRHKLSDYCVRLYAVVRDGREVIIGQALNADWPESKALLMPESPEALHDPKSDVPVRLSWNNGPEWFEFQFDRQSKKLTRFEINTHPSPI